VKIGILGGTFNPIHNGHLLIAEEVKDHYALDKIIFIPNKKPPHKEIADYIPDIHRINMIKLAINTNPDFIISTKEIDRGGVSYTIDTIYEIQSEIDIDDKIHFIIGADLISELSTWKEWDNLAKIVQFVVLNRGEEIAIEYLDKYPFIQTLQDTINFDVTSSLIRKKIKESKSIKYLVPDNVLEYIKKENLYVK